MGWLTKGINHKFGGEYENGGGHGTRSDFKTTSTVLL